MAFTHGQLRWMAETMASLVPWGIRTRPNRYLSFLPMSHVVEGILGTYSPYDLPAPVEVTFLEDFRRVAATLPAVRPTVFFSVPRLYQKVWEGVGRSRIGTRYQRMRAGPLRLILRPAVRRAMLRRAGLDRCAQLLVGSAAVDEQLLRSFHELGVEIHEAYGLTEAPLVALNRLGRNRIGSSGELLPETQVRVADDGELEVRGPQVMAGYVEEDEQPFRDGWLQTGDLGHVTGDGRLVIDGRKKDLLKTAYGKYLQPSKIEAMLRRIPGVTEAMVVGEGRPFCAALLWVEGTGDAATVDASVAEMNRRLSHPEQVKRWTVLPNDLSIEGGELTANLKLRRHEVEARFHGEIERLYQEHPTGPVRNAVGGERGHEPPPAGARAPCARRRGAFGAAPSLRGDGVRVRQRARGTRRDGSPGAARTIRIVHGPLRRADAVGRYPARIRLPVVCGRTRMPWANRSAVGSASEPGRGAARRTDRLPDDRDRSAGGPTRPRRGRSMHIRRELLAPDMPRHVRARRGPDCGAHQGGRLAFSERITEGRPQCVARISWEGAST